MERVELLIVGAGAAGMSAAVSAWNEGCRSILLIDSRSAPGGVLPQCIHEGFGLGRYGRELTGPEYAAALIKELKATGVKLLLNVSVLAVEKDKTALLSGKELGLVRIGFDRLILACGASERSFGTLDIESARPAGIYTAGQAQEMINLRSESVGNTAVVLGSGDLGLIIARRLLFSGKKVAAIVEKEDHCGGLARNRHRCVEETGIPLLLSSTVTKVHGARRVEGVTVRNSVTGEERFLSCDTLITAVGLVPEQELVRELKNENWIYLCGNCREIYELADTAYAQSAEAGADAARAAKEEVAE